MIKEHMHVLAVPDLTRSSAFYRDVLGFEIRELTQGWLVYVNGSCRIMAGECRDAIPPRELGDHSYFAYLVVENVDGYHDRAATEDRPLPGSSAVGRHLHARRDWLA